MATSGKSAKFLSLDELFLNQVEIKDWSEVPSNTEIISKSALSLKVKTSLHAEISSPEKNVSMKKYSSLPNFKKSSGFTRNRSPIRSDASGCGSANKFPSSSSVDSSSKQVLPSLRDPPFYVYAANINFRASRTDLFYFFGGKDCVKQIHMYQSNHNRFEGDCFIQVVDNREVFQDVLKKDHHLLLDRPVLLFAVDPKNGRKYLASLFCSQPDQVPSVGGNSLVSSDARKISRNSGPENRGIRDKKDANSGGIKCDVFLTPPAKDRPPQVKANQDHVAHNDLSSSKRVIKPRKVRQPQFVFPQMDRALPSQ